MRKLLAILLLCCMTASVSALSIREQNINRIKKSRAFLYSDVTAETGEKAASQAYEQIQQEILSWAMERSRKKDISNVPATEMNKVVDTIMTRRATMYRVVAYVRKSKLVTAFREWKLSLDPVLDVDKPGTEEDTDSMSIDLPPVSAPSETHEEKADTVVPPSSQPKPAAAKDTIVANDSIRGLLIKNYLGRKGGVIEQIKKARNFFELKQIMEPLKQKGDIAAYGKYATAEHPEECYLIVYDPAGNIKALLGKGKKTRQNLKTGRDDSIDNYRGCGAIWFILSE